MYCINIQEIMFDSWKDKTDMKEWTNIEHLNNTKEDYEERLDFFHCLYAQLTLSLLLFRVFVYW
jgi:hypothetical protein